MSSDDYWEINGRLYAMECRLRALEVQPPQADMVQPLVGPPDAGRLSEEPAALARRQTIAEVLTLIEEIKGLPHKNGFTEDYLRAWRACCNLIHQQLASR